MKKLVLDGKVAQKVLRVRQGYGALLRPILVRRPVQMLADGCCAFAAVVAAYALRFDFDVPSWARQGMWALAFVSALLNPIALWISNGYRSTWQFFGLRDLWQLVQRLAIVCVIVESAQVLFVPQRRAPFTVAVFSLLLAVCFSSCVRLMRRIDHEALARIARTDRVLVLGASNAIAGAIRQLRPLFGASLCGAITNDERFHKSLIAGVPILGTMDALGDVIHGKHINLLFVCSADLPELSLVMQTAGAHNVSVKFLPCVDDYLADRVHVAKKLTAAKVHATTSRTPVSLHEDVRECLAGRTVLVTGAAGSIGSELVRQILGTGYKKLYLVDHDENAMYELLNELGWKAGTESVIADIRDEASIRALFLRVQPEIVLHAAAYKHVPMMQANPCQAILNNMIGTRVLAELAVECGVDRLVMISSDKAVRPSSVMGASKRLAELVIQQVSRRAGRTTKFACVRFGNVLGSRGSVLPMFLKQIQAGGPVTVTHEEMTRYFMTIPQAVSLVLQAATLAGEAHVYMLDMGDPVKIIQFARDVIHQSGLVPGDNIEIQVTGVRPGEKLHEQLWAEGARVTETGFEQIYRVHAEELLPSVSAQLLELEAAAYAFDEPRVWDLLHELPIDYIGEARQPLASMTA